MKSSHFLTSVCAAVLLFGVQPSAQAAPGDVGIEVVAPDTVEEGSILKFKISIEGGHTEDVDVTFSLSGTATVGDDYTDPGTTITVPANTASVDLTITTIDDGMAEADETVIVTLDSTDPALTITQSEATGTIQDVDRGGGTPPTTTRPTKVRIKATRPNAAEPRTNGKFTVFRNHSKGETNVFFTVKGSATSGSDYKTLPAFVTIKDGKRKAPIHVITFDDSRRESTETVRARISRSAGYKIRGKRSATVSIRDNDTYPFGSSRTSGIRDQR